MVHLSSSYNSLFEIWFKPLLKVSITLLSLLLYFLLSLPLSCSLFSSTSFSFNAHIEQFITVRLEASIISSLMQTCDRAAVMWRLLEQIYSSNKSYRQVSQVSSTGKHKGHHLHPKDLQTSGLLGQEREWVFRTGKRVGEEGKLLKIRYDFLPYSFLAPPTLTSEERLMVSISFFFFFSI